MMMGCRRSFTMGLGRTPYLFSYFMFATHLKSVIGSVAGTPLLGRVGWGEGGGQNKWSGMTCWQPRYLSSSVQRICRWDFHSRDSAFC